MTPLVELYLPGAIAFWCALAFAVAALWGWADLARGDQEGRRFARRAYGFFALAILFDVAINGLARVLTPWVRAGEEAAT